MSQVLYSTINDLVLSAYRQYGDNKAVRWLTGKDQDEGKSYSEFCTDIAILAAVISSLTDEGSHIALTGATSYKWLTSYFAITCSGRVAVPLDVMLPADEMCDQINRADTTLFIVDEIRKDVCMKAVADCPGLKNIISMQAEGDEGKILSYDGLMAGKTADVEAVLDNKKHSPDDLCTIMYTSGTTGKSKGVMLTHRNLAENATCLDMNIKTGTSILTVLPIHHAYCLSMDILKGVSLGSAICINDSLLHMAQNIKYFEPEIILMVPMMIETFGKKLKAGIAQAQKAMAAAPTPPDAAALKAQADAMRVNVFGRNLHTIYSGGAYLNPEYIDLFAKIGLDLIQGYGMTENAPVISNGYGEHIKRESVGRPLPNCEVRIVDGEITVRGSSVMQGYYKMPKETEETLIDGWLHTGDLGYVDEDGFIFLTGRKKNLIITKNGENVSPEELENKLSEQDAIKEMIARENEGFIEAVIFPDMDYMAQAGVTDVTAHLQGIIDEFNKMVPPYKQIHKLTVRDTEFDKTPSKKIKRW